MVRIAGVVKEGRSKKDKLEIQDRSKTTPSSVAVSDLFKRSEVAQTNRELCRRLYDESLTLVKEVIERQKANEVFEIKAVRDSIERMLNQLETANGDILIGLTLTNSTLEDNYLYAHSVNVCLIALRLGMGLNMDKLELVELGIEAFLHDIGMLKVPQEIINKSGNLSPEEFDIIKRHPSESYNGLKGVGNIEESTLGIVRQHHEKLNGAGYPEGLTGERINNHSKIIRLVDSYEAIVHPRAWRKAILPDEAVKELLDMERDFYEPYILKVFLKEFSLYPVGSWVELNTKEVAEVIRVNPKVISRPILKVVFDPDGYGLKKPKLVNLSESPLIHINKCIEPKEL